MEQTVLEAQAQAVQATEDQAMRAISAIQVEATRVNENLIGLKPMKP